MRNDEDVERAARTAVEHFGGIDICGNNASAVALDGTEALSMKRFDLMQQINVRGTFALTRACLPHLRNVGERAHPDAVPATQPEPALAGPPTLAPPAAHR